MKKFINTLVRKGAPVVMGLTCLYIVASLLLIFPADIPMSLSMAPVVANSVILLYLILHEIVELHLRANARYRIEDDVDFFLDDDKMAQYRREFLEFTMKMDENLYGTIIEEKYWREQLCSFEWCMFLLTRLCTLSNCCDINRNAVYIAKCFRDPSAKTQRYETENRGVTHILVFYRATDTEHKHPVIVDPLCESYNPMIESDYVPVCRVIDDDLAMDIYDIIELYDPMRLTSFYSKKMGMMRLNQDMRKGEIDRYKAKFHDYHSLPTQD